MSEAEACVTREQARFLWWLSGLTLANGIYAGGWCGQWDLSAIMILTYLTSIAYWWHPTKGMRQLVDMYTVRANLASHLWAGATRGSHWSYFVLTATALSCYGVSVAIHKRGRWDSVFWHAGLHVLGNAGHLVLYRSVAAALG
jgi:hypothetical protein